LIPTPQQRILENQMLILEALSQLLIRAPQSSHGPSLATLVMKLADAQGRTQATIEDIERDRR